MKNVFFLVLFACSSSVFAQQTFNNDLLVTVQKSVDGKQYKTVLGKHVPWASTSEFLSAVTSSRRHIGEIAYIISGNKIYPYQFVNCINDTCLRILGDTLNLDRVGDSLVLSSGTSRKSIFAPISVIPTISSGTTAPSSTPAKVGDIYIDRTAKKLYFASGTSSSGDWTIAN